MYERFTDRARMVMQLANQEAQRFNHEYIGTEHILLGLAKEGSGIGSMVLKNLGVDIRNVRLEVEKLVTSGPEMVTMGRIPQTPRTKKVIERAMEESRDLKHNYVGTEHLLLGLLREQEGVAAQVLMNLGVTIEAAREGVKSMTGRDGDAANQETLADFPTEFARMVQSILSQSPATPITPSLIIRNADSLVLEYFGPFTTIESAYQFLKVVDDGEKTLEVAFLRTP